MFNLKYTGSTPDLFRGKTYHLGQHYLFPYSMDICSLPLIFLIWDNFLPHRTWWRLHTCRMTESNYLCNSRHMGKESKMQKEKKLTLSNAFCITPPERSYVNCTRSLLSPEFTCEEIVAQRGEGTCPSSLGINWQSRAFSPGLSGIIWFDLSLRASGPPQMRQGPRPEVLLGHHFFSKQVISKGAEIGAVPNRRRTTLRRVRRTLGRKNSPDPQYVVFASFLSK